jgi:hypothetical protein
MSTNTFEQRQRLLNRKQRAARVQSSEVDRIQQAHRDLHLAVDADPAAGMKYAKIIGEKEKAVESVKFDFLGVYRPAVILGNSNTPGVRLRHATTALGHAVQIPLHPQE